MRVIKRDTVAQIINESGKFIALIEQAPLDSCSFWVETSLVPISMVDEATYTYDFTAIDLDAAIAHTLFLIESELLQHIEELKEFSNQLEKDKLDA